MCQTDGLDFATMVFDDILSNNIIDRPVSAFDQDVRNQGTYQLIRSILSKEADVIDATKRRENDGAIFVRIDRASFPFNPPDGCIRVQADDQYIPEFPCSLQILDVPTMQNVERAIGEDDFFPLSAQLRAKPQELSHPDDFSHYRPPE